MGILDRKGARPYPELERGSPWAFPPRAVVSIGLSPLLPFPFLWSVVLTEPPSFHYFTSLCRVYTEEGNCLRRWLGASKRSSHAGGEGPLPNGGFWALGCPRAGSFSPTRAHNNLPPALSRAESSLWRAHHVPPTPLCMSMVRVLCPISHAWHTWVWCVAGGVGCWAGMGSSSSVRLMWGGMAWWRLACGHGVLFSSAAGGA